ncbi:hypothetical protein GJV76_14870, partial [Myroides sp. BIT-d1]|nr:hypothetical protein [Myroides albus]
MKKRIIPIAFLLSGMVSYAQVGIGVKEPDKSAILELQAKDKGLLIPKIALTGLFDTQSIYGNNPKEGLLVYNTTNNGDALLPGYYFWGIDYNDKENPNRPQWVKIGDNLSDKVNNKMMSYGIEDNAAGQKVFSITDAHGHTIDVPLIDLQLVATLEKSKTNKAAYVYTNEHGHEFVIDVLADVINHFGDIINNDQVVQNIVNKLKGKFGNVIFEGDKFYTV